MTEQQCGLDLTDLIGARVRGMQEYAPEPLSETARRLGVPVESLIKLDANENPYGPTERAAQVLRAYSEHHRYPDPTAWQLRQAIGAYLGVDPDCVVMGNGSDELIDLTLRVFRPAPHTGGGIGEVIDCQPSFGMYAFYGVANDMEVVEVPRLSDYTLDLAAIEALCARDPRPRVLFVASPNNPDGQLLPEAALRRLLALPLLVVLDEAYIEFSGATRVGWVAQHENLVVLRTFSKWAGLAGLRVGYGVFPEALASALLRLKSPYNVNGAAQAAALATLEDVEQALARVRLLIAERERLLARLQQLPMLQAYPSAANYILCRVQGVSLQELRRQMEAQGILLRYYGSGALVQCIRISVGTPAQNDAVIAALQALPMGA